MPREISQIYFIDALRNDFFRSLSEPDALIQVPTWVNNPSYMTRERVVNMNFIVPGTHIT